MPSGVLPPLEPEFEAIRMSEGKKVKMLCQDYFVLKLQPICAIFPTTYWTISKSSMTDLAGKCPISEGLSAAQFSVLTSMANQLPSFKSIDLQIHASNDKAERLFRKLGATRIEAFPNGREFSFVNMRCQ